jgi:hypothetical protein
VLAAAVAARADVIVTANLKDFPPPVCAPLGVEVMNEPKIALEELLQMLTKATPTFVAQVRIPVQQRPGQLARTTEATANAAAYDPDVQRQIWQLSLDLTGAPDPS